MQPKSTLRKILRLPQVAALVCFLLSVQVSLAQRTENTNKPLQVQPGNQQSQRNLKQPNQQKQAFTENRGKQQTGEISVNNAAKDGSNPAITEKKVALQNRMMIKNTSLAEVAAQKAAAKAANGGAPVVESYGCDDGWPWHNAGFEWITNVTFAGINNSTGNVSGWATEPIDYTSQVATVTQGGIPGISVSMEPDANDYIYVFIDWNQNGVWDLATERYIIAGPVNDPGAYTGNIGVPLTAALGTTRMRVAVVWDDDTWNGCTDTWGEIEEYTVEVLEAGACTGTPDPGNTISSVVTACAGVNFDLSLENLIGSSTDYQWQRSTDGGVTWNDFGANTPTVSVSQTVATQYQCIVTCNVSSETTTSTPVSIGMNSYLNCYCAASATNMFERIDVVQFGSINNSSGASGTGYQDFTSISTDVLQGTIIPFTVTINNGWSGDRIKIWLDLNLDGDFDDAGELLYTAPANSAGPFTGSVTIPGTASVGQSRLRIRLYDNTATVSNGPCGTDTWGQVEDYTVQILFNPPCDATPAPGNTISSASSVCNTNTVNLSLQNAVPGQGITYLWQFSTDDGASWSPLPGLNFSPTYTGAVVTDTTWYRCLVTCTLISESAVSTPVKVGLNPFLDCYCEPSMAFGCTDGDVITRVKINNLDNETECDSPDGFTDFSETIEEPTEILIGVNNKIRIEVGTDWPKAVAVWIDYNRNGVYDPSEHYLGGFLPAATGVIEAFIAVPDGLPVGEISKMRVALMYSGGWDFTPTEACLPFGDAFGEIEDYLVQFVPCVPATIGTHPASASAVCGNDVTFTAAINGHVEEYSWQWRADASAVWQTVADGGIYSGASTETLTLTGVTADYTGYQYRLLVTGACSAPNPTNAATLTVTPIIPVVSPSSATICNGAVQQLSLTNSVGGVLLTESFTTAIPLPSGWASQNLSDITGSTSWFQGNPAVFPSTTGDAGYMAANYNSTAGSIISNWLFTPELTLNNGDELTFYARAIDGGWADRLQVRLSTSGASVNAGATPTSTGDFGTLLLDINPTYQSGVFVNAWTKYTITVSGLPGTSQGRVAFRYFVENGGPAGSRSDFIGIDEVVYTAAPTPVQGVWTGPAGTIFTDAAGTVAYDGSPATTVYVAPTVTSNYQVSFSTPLCQSAVTTVPVTVAQPVSNVVSPVNRAICVGANTSFTASASGSPLTYQWQLSTDGGTTWANVANGGIYAGATTTTLTLTGVPQTANNNRYRVVINAGVCAGNVASGAAVLTVNALPVVTISAPDVLLTPPETAIITATSTPAAAAGGWSWTYNNSAIAGNTSGTQTATVDALGSYRATVTDVNGCVASSNVLVIGAEATDKLWIYPNPTDGQFQVRLYFHENIFSENRTIAIFNQLGQLVAKKDLNILRNNNTPYLSQNFDLRHVSPGVYVVRVTHQFTGKMVSGLIVIQ